MASASWLPVSNGITATWDDNKQLADAQRNALTYDDPNTDFDSLAVFYDGYDPNTGQLSAPGPTIWGTPPAANGAAWTAVAE